jgi:hypothetical protein
MAILKYIPAGDGFRGVRQYAVPYIGVADDRVADDCVADNRVADDRVADDRVAHHAGVYFYVDKELLVKPKISLLDFFFF